ncbi:hypothetical protein ScPMuIL_018068 [Solemya velum]
MTSIENKATGSSYKFVPSLQSNLSVDAAPLTPTFPPDSFPSARTISQPSDAFDQSLSPASSLGYNDSFSQDNESLLESKAKCSKKQIESIIDDPGDLQKYFEEMPPHLRVGYFDVGILYTEEDREEVERYKEHLERDISPLLNNKRKIKVVLFDGPEMMALTGGLIKQLEILLERCTQIFIYMTEVFCKEAWMTYATEACIVEAVYNDEKKWCCVPIFLHPRGNSPFKIPMCLNCLKGVNYYSDDQFYRRGASRLIGDKMFTRLQKEKEHCKRQKDWIMKKKQKEAFDQSQRRIAKKQHEFELEKHRRNMVAREAEYEQYYSTQLSKESKEIRYFPQPNHVDQKVPKEVKYFDTIYPLHPVSAESPPKEKFANIVDTMHDLMQTKSSKLNNTVVQQTDSRITHTQTEDKQEDIKKISSKLQIEHENGTMHSDMHIQSPRSDRAVDLQNKAISCYNNDNRCSNFSSAQQDAAASIQSGEPQVRPNSPQRTESVIVSPNLEPEIPQDNGSIRSSAHANLPNMSLLDNEQSVNEEFTNDFDDKDNQASLPRSDVNSRSTKAATIPNLSPFTSLNTSLDSGSLRPPVSITCPAAADKTPTSHLSAEAQSQANNPPHQLKSSLPGTDLDEDAHSVASEGQPDGSPSVQGRKPKVIIREIHHHHYEARDQPKKVINITGARIVQIGDNRISTKDDSDDEFVDVPQEAEGKNSSSGEKTRNPKMNQPMEGFPKKTADPVKQVAEVKPLSTAFSDPLQQHVKQVAEVKPLSTAFSDPLQQHEQDLTTQATTSRQNICQVTNESNKGLPNPVNTTEADTRPLHQSPPCHILEESFTSQTSDDTSLYTQEDMKGNGADHTANNMGSRCSIS